MDLEPHLVATLAEVDRLRASNAELRVALGKIVDLADDYSTEQTRFWRSVAIAQAAVAKYE